MVDHDAMIEHDLAALLTGRGFVQMVGIRTIRVGGSEATAWMHDLLSADIAGLVPGAACRSLLLSPTGYVRADVQVVRRRDDTLLLQDGRQEEDVATILQPYVLSAEVSLEDVTEQVMVFAIPDAAAVPGNTDHTSPSWIGSGVDVIAVASDAEPTRTALLDAGLSEHPPAAADAWRIVRGVPTMGAEFDARSLPAEAGLDALIDTTKGCFLGQESVARVRNLGHPPRVLRHVRCEAALARGVQVRDGDAIVGEVTGAIRYDGAWIGFVRVAWSAATTRLADIDGHPLHDARPPG
jgi:tRNA-modifying protein YgfZ